MKNFIWSRNPKEAYENPYEYEAQEQFSREAFKVLSGFIKHLKSYDLKFTRDERSLEKALWMLFLDAVDSLLECHNYLTEKNHKIAGRLFRDAFEVMDLSALFSSGTDKSKRLLEKWYDDKVIPNREYRDYIKKHISVELAEKHRVFYSQISKINHRTYKSLAYGYVLGGENKFAYDGFQKSKILVYPGVLSMYYSLLANSISIFSSEIKKCSLLPNNQIEEIWDESIEKEPECRRFETVKMVNEYKEE